MNRFPDVPRRIRLWIRALLFGACCLAAPMAPASAQPLSAPPQHCLTRMGQAQVNWSTGMVRAFGKAVPADRKKASTPDYILSVARSNAGKHLIYILTHLELTAGRRVKDVVAGDDHLLAGIEKIALDAPIVHQLYTSDKTMSVVLETSLYGGYLQSVLPEEISQIPVINVSGPVVDPSSPSRFTGMVIDARAIGFEPVLYPRVISELGSDIYSAVMVSREFAVQNGVCGYACLPDPELIRERAGDNPVRVKGLRKEGPGNAAIVISRSDGERIEKIRERHRFMRRCRVMILVDPPAVRTKNEIESSEDEKGDQ